MIWGQRQSLGSQEKKDLRKNFNINIENGGLMTVKLIPEPVKMMNSWHIEKLRSLCIYKGDGVRNIYILLTIEKSRCLTIDLAGERGVRG